MSKTKPYHWRDRSRELEEELRELKAKEPTGDETIEYLLRSAETLLSAADTLIEIRHGGAEETEECEHRRVKHSAIPGKPAWCEDCGQEL